MLVAHSLISAQLRKSPSWAWDGRGHGPVGEAQVLPDQLAGEHLVVAGPVGRQDLRDVHGLSAGLAGSPTWPLENSHTGAGAETGPAAPVS